MEKSTVCTSDSPNTLQNLWGTKKILVNGSRRKYENTTMKMSFQGSVQRKLRWVENGVNRSLGASDCGDGHSFVILYWFHLGFTIFPFPVSTAEFIGEFWKNKRSATSDVAPIVLALYRNRYWRYVDSFKAKRGVFAAPIGEAQRIRSAI
jgi:hypothetical protein